MLLGIRSSSTCCCTTTRNSILQKDNDRRRYHLNDEKNHQRLTLLSNRFVIKGETTATSISFLFVSLVLSLWLQEQGLVLVPTCNAFSIQQQHHQQRRVLFDKKVSSYISKTSTSTTKTTVLKITKDDIDISYSLNPLFQYIKPSKTVEIFSLVKTLESQGMNVTSLCVGEPDFPPSQCILDGTIQAIVNQDTKYTAVAGTVLLRKAIAHDLQKRKHITYDPLKEIVIGNGAKQCVYQALVVCVSPPYDQVLIPGPYWPSYPEQVLLAGAQPVLVSTTAKSGYLLTPEQLRSTLETNTNITVLILCNPSNPTGGVYTKEQLQDLCTVLYDYPKVRVVADEIYERLTYTDDTDTDDSEANDEQTALSNCPSVASIPGMFHRTLTINGFSKAYAMTGYRLGYVAAPAPYASAITTLQGQLTSCASSLSQAAGYIALTQVTEKELNHNIQIMKLKRNYVVEQLRSIPDVTLECIPKGAFYVLPDVSYYCDIIHPNDEEADVELCLELLNQYQLAVVPGSSFGAPGTIRLSYATSMEELQIAMDKLKQYFTKKRTVT